MREVSRYGAWPLVPRDDNRPGGEHVLACGGCRSWNITLTGRYASHGTGPGGRGRLGDPGAINYAQCNDCGARAHLSKTELSDLTVGVSQALAMLAGPLVEWVEHDTKRMQSHVCGAAGTYVQIKTGMLPSDEDIIRELNRQLNGRLMRFTRGNAAPTWTCPTHGYNGLERTRRVQHDICICTHRLER